MEMKFLGCLFLIFSLNVYAQDCNRFRTGTFEVDNMDGTVSIVKRTEKFQIETCGKIKTKDKIVWINDCSYKLIPVKIKDQSGRIGDEVLTFTFVKTYDHSYIVEITGLGDMVIEARVFEEGYLELSEE